VPNGFPTVNSAGKLAVRIAPDIGRRWLGKPAGAPFQAMPFGLIERRQTKMPGAGGWAGERRDLSDG